MSRPFQMIPFDTWMKSFCLSLTFIARNSSRIWGLKSFYKKFNFIFFSNLIGGPSGLQSREEELKVKEEFLSFAVNFLNNLEKFSKSKVFYSFFFFNFLHLCLILLFNFYSTAFAGNRRRIPSQQECP